MKIKLELFGVSKELSNKNYLNFNIKNKISIKEFRQEIIKYININFKGNKNYKKIIKTSVFCSEENNIINDSYKIKKDQIIGIIPPIGGG